MRTFVISTALVSAVVVACGGASPSELGTPFTGAADRTVVVGDGKGTVLATPTGSDCVNVGSTCVKPQDKCGPGARADIIVDPNGNVVEIVCYPPLADATAPTESTGNVELGKDNKAVVTLDGVADGVDIVGNVASAGNNVTVYGQGPGVSVIGGSVTAEGNNFSLRGVTVQKNVEVRGNNATAVLCEVFGDFLVEGNNAVIAECTIFGKLTIRGNNAKLVANKVAGGIVVEGKETVCSANVAFVDTNENRVLDSGETGAALTCEGGKK